VPLAVHVNYWLNWDSQNLLKKLPCQLTPSLFGSNVFADAFSVLIQARAALEEAKIEGYLWSISILLLSPRIAVTRS